MHLLKVRILSENYPNSRYYPFNIPGDAGTGVQATSGLLRG